MYDTLARTSGAVLGYIHGGIRGGFLGYKLGKRLGKTYPKMAAIPLHKKRGYGKYVLKRKKVHVKRKRVTKVHKRHKSKPVRSRVTSLARATQQATQQISQHNDMSYKIGHVWVHKPKHNRKLFGRYWYENTWDFVNNGVDEGRQNTDETKRVLTRKQIVGTTSNNRLDNDNWACDPVLLNPFVNSDATPSSYFTTLKAKDQDRFHLEYYTEKLHLVSESLIPMKVKIYWLQYRKSTADSVSTVWTNLLSKMSLGQSAPVPAQYTNTLTATAGQPTINEYGMDPFSCPGFKRMFRLLKSETVILQPGDQRYYSNKFEIHRTFERAVFNEIDSGTNYLANITIVPFIITYGGLVVVRDAISGSRAEVTPGQTKYGCFVQQKFCFRAVKNDRINSMRWFPGHIQNSTGATDHGAITNDSATNREYEIDDVDAIIANSSMDLSNVP